VKCRGRRGSVPPGEGREMSADLGSEKEKSFHLQRPGTSRNSHHLFCPKSSKCLVHPTHASTNVEVNFEFILSFSLEDGSQTCPHSLQVLILLCLL